MEREWEGLDSNLGKGLVGDTRRVRARVCVRVSVRDKVRVRVRVEVRVWVRVIVWLG